MLLKNTNTQKGYAHLLLLVVVILAVLVGVYVLGHKTDFQPQAYRDQEVTYPEVNNAKDLDAALENVDNIDIGQADQTLDQNSSDAASL